MSSSYVTTAEFQNASPGARWDDLAAGELASYINRASSAIEQYCNRSFVYNASVVESLISGQSKRAVIDQNGWLWLYPRRFFPIVSVASITWQVKAPVWPSGLQSTSTQTVTAADIQVLTDAFNDGYAIEVFEDFSSFRGPRVTVLYTLTYAGGYQTTYPDWLTEAAIRWTAGLLKVRGAEALAAPGNGGGLMDSSNLGGEIRKAKEILTDHMRLW